QASTKKEPQDPSTLHFMYNYTGLLAELGRIEEASDWAVRTMDGYLRVLKLKHPDTQDAIASLVALKTINGRFQEALGIADRALEEARRELGPDDSRTLEFLRLRAGVLFFMGDLAKAGSSAEELIAGRTRRLGP